MVSFKPELRFPLNRNCGFHSPDRRCNQPRITQDPEKYLMYIFSRITDHNYRNIPELPELLEEFLPWIQEVQKECHSTRFMAKRSNEQPLPKMAQKE